ncbi:uncharacterized protein N7506_003184 [Penicillium brevicompactum]|uniref:uncharacterized protein n=1 Tax=Penicillium brevicompactum TaxID=5074 RepID=UPI0025425DEE|nr:uncharacterized protein N7506_003184 [Penicillium brevicompactum]KAJ5343360.1 hypothetical protein N7506_003184 [Penicillium brevicompactum]
MGGHAMRLVLVPVRGDLATQLQVARPSDPLGEIPLPARVSTNSRGHPPPRALPDTSLPQGPSHAPRREHISDGVSHNRTSSPPKLTSPPTTLALSGSEPRRSPLGAEEPNFIPQGPRARSPIHPIPPSRFSKPASRSPHLDQHQDSDAPLPPKRIDHDDRDAMTPPSLDQGQPPPSGPRMSGSVPTQPKNHSAGPVSQPPSGPYQGPRPPSHQHRASPNVSMLSAPTRPRRGPSSREPWTGPPSSRRGSAALSHGPPVGPRASFSPPTAGGGGIPPVNPPATERVSALIPEGKSFSNFLDPAVEKRLCQLETDREKLLEQIAETQRTKRVELRDWDRLDRESAICALKSELAEGHLQRMADESIGGGILF